MALNRVRIADVADALGLSTATVSKVIHGKTEKISDETVKRVQQELERSGYIPNMAGILLARNNSRIIGVVVNDNEKYEGRVLEDTKEAWCSFDVSLICGIMISALFLFAAGVFPSWILGLYTKDVSIVNTGAVYFRIVVFSYIPMAVSNILSSWLRCKEHATIPFLASFEAVAVNTGLNYLLIFGKLGLPCMGIKGASDRMLSLQYMDILELPTWRLIHLPALYRGLL